MYRHRKVDVLDQIEIPGFDEKLIWLKFTNLEKQLYEAKIGKVPRNYLQQLCCHPMVIESTKKIFGDVEVDLALMQDKLIDYHQANYLNYKSKIEKLDKTKPEYHMLFKTYNTSMSESQYLYTMLTQMRDRKIDEHEKCAICLDEIDNPTLTACGHLFCYECLKMCLGDKKKCPMCKADLTGKELLVTNKKVETDGDAVNPLIKKYGSKLGKTISIIRSLVAQPKSRIIVFSQWDDMLSLIGKTLSENEEAFRAICMSGNGQIFYLLCASRGNQLRIFVSVKKPHYKVTNQVNSKEPPVTVWHCFRRVEAVIDCVCPHEAQVIQQVHWDLPPNCEQL
jgi:SNF2 family DNA or RNA helicase